MLNKVNLIGRLTKDPESKTYSEGTLMTGFTLVVDRQFKSEKGPAADFIPVSAWRKTAEFVQKYFAKGKQVYVSGRLETFTYEVDGQRRCGFRVTADEVGFADTKRDAEDGSDGLNPLAGAEMPMPEEDDLPF